MRQKAWTAVLSLFLLLLLFSCNTSTETTGTVRLYVGSSNTRTIRPSTFIAPKSYKITLTQSEGDSVERTFNQTSGAIEIEGINMGTYTVLVEGYEKEDCQGMKTCVSSPSTPTLTVKPTEVSSITVQMEAVMEENGTGSIKVTFDWTGLSADVETPFNDALKTGILYFQLLYVNDDGVATPQGEAQKAVIEEGVTSYTFELSGLPVTKGQSIAFNVTDKNGQMIAYKKFSSTLQIAAGQVSTPDSNDTELFYITNTTAPSYGRNVSKVSWQYDDEKPETAVVITWSNPTSYDGTVLADTVDLVLKKTTGETVYEITEEVSTATSSHKFDGLEKGVEYELSTRAHLTDGRSSQLEEVYFTTPIQTKILVTGIEINGKIPEKLTYGEHFELGYTVTPENASIQTAKWSVSNEGVLIINGNTFTANKPGRTNITVTSDENIGSFSDTTDQYVSVYLATPSGMTATPVNDTAESSCYTYVSWNSVLFAESYDVYRSVDGIKEETSVNVTGTSYNDYNVQAGRSYTYSVVAKYADETGSYDSAESPASKAVETVKPTIEIKAPVFGETKLEISKGGDSILIMPDQTQTISLSKAVDGAVNYSWYINSTKVKEGTFESANTITIGMDSKGLDGGSENGEQELKLNVTLSDNTIISATIKFNAVTVKDESVEANWLTKSGKRLPVSIGESFKINARVWPYDATLQALTYSSVDEDIAKIDQSGNMTITGYGDVEITIKPSTGEALVIPFSFYNPTLKSAEQLINAVNSYLKTHFDVANSSFESDWRGGRDWNAGVIGATQTYKSGAITIVNSEGGLNNKYGKLTISEAMEISDMKEVKISTSGITLYDEAGSYMSREKLVSIGNTNESIFVSLPDNQGSATIIYDSIQVNGNRGGSYIVTFSQDVGDDGENPTIKGGSSKTFLDTDTENITSVIFSN